MPEKREQVTFRIPEELLRRIELTDELSKQQHGAGINKSDLFRNALDEYLDSVEELEAALEEE